MFRDFSALRSREDLFNKQLAESQASREADRDLRRETLAQSAGQWQQAHALQREQMLQTKARQDEANRRALLGMMASGEVKQAPSQTLVLNPTSGGDQTGEDPSTLDALGGRSSIQNLQSTGFLPKQVDVPVNESMFVGGQAVVPASPTEKLQRQLDFQGMVADAQTKRLEADALHQYPGEDEGWKRRLYVIHKGDINKALTNPQEALNTILFDKSRTEGDFSNAVQAMIAQQLKARMAGAGADPTLAALRMFQLNNLRANAGSEELLGKVGTDINTDPRFAGMPAPKKADLLRQQINSSKADPRVKALALKQVDDTLRLPSEQQQNAFSVIMQQFTNR